MINKATVSSVLRFSLFSLGHFLKEIENIFMFLSSYKTVVKVWENMKKL